MIDVKGRTADLLLQMHGIPQRVTREMFAAHFLSENYCRRVLVAHEFKERVKGGMAKTDIKVLLSERYCISYSTVEKYIQQILNGSAPT